MPPSRPRKKTPKPAIPKVSEDDICKHFMRLVELYVSMGQLDHFDVFHVPNGTSSGNLLSRKINGARQRDMGQRRGVADYVLFGRHYLEMKTPTGRQSDEQREFEAWCARRGATYVLKRTADEALAYVLQLKTRMGI